jgi:type IV pilus assembly protein PilE
MRNLHTLVGPRTVRGFTLIEVMVVVAIIGILAAIAYPSYQDSVVRANRRDAMGVVQAAAQAMERYALQNNTYNCGTCTGVIPTKSPIDGARTVYTITVGNLGETTYTITATPQAGGPNAGDGNITLNQTGARTWNGNNSWD